MRVAVYIRVSTEEQARAGVSLEVQERRCREVATTAGATEVAVYRDEGYSGTTTDRPALRALLGELRDFSALYVWKLDRLSRRLRDVLDIKAELEEADVAFVSATEGGDDGTPAGRLSLHMVASVSEYFIGILRENVKAALVHRARAGKPHGPAPLGYDWPRGGARETVGDVWQVAHEEAEIVREVFASYHGGASLTGLAQNLNRRGVRTPRGGANWTHTTVRNILCSPAYIGRFRFGGEVYEGRHEALVDDETWRAVQRRLTRRAGTHSRSLDRSLSPVYRCGVCRGNVSRQKRDATHYSYTCARRREGVDHVPVFCSGNASDAAVWAWVRHLLDEDVIERAAELQAEKARKQQAEEKKDSTAQQLVEVERRIERNLEAYHAKALPADMLAEQNEPLIVARDKLREHLAAEAMQVTQTDMRRLRETTREALDDLIEQGDMDRQQELLGLLFERVEIMPGRRVVFHHRIGELPAKTIDLPTYYSPERGRTRIDLQL